ncbi:MAG: hypothetical protein JXR94_24830, partial [Candidatus Hydrogenedentes bacterium]|nr:hypothetical protein [Candidatus Hydrogenedentota bacterium]
MINRRHTTNRPARSNARRGSAMILALGYLAAISIFAAAFLTLIHRTMSNMARTQRTRAAVTIAEGGIDKAVAQLRAHGADYRGERGTPLGDGRFTVVAKPAGPAAYRIASEGWLTATHGPGARARVAAELQLDAAGRVRAFRWVET